MTTIERLRALLDDPKQHGWQGCCCKASEDGHCWQCGAMREHHDWDMPFVDGARPRPNAGEAP